jgi:hypothetical protein
MSDYTPEGYDESVVFIPEFCSSCGSRLEFMNAKYGDDVRWCPGCNICIDFADD